MHETLFSVFHHHYLQQHRMASGILPDWGTGLIYLFFTFCFLLVIIRCYSAVTRRFETFYTSRNVQRNFSNENNLNEHPSELQSIGLGTAVIHSLPSLQFREEIKKGHDQDDASCAVCLGEFAEGEWLRLLPNCAHVFHVSCIDTWFMSHSTCPLCRVSVLYDINSAASSVSAVALLAVLQREDSRPERPLEQRLMNSASTQTADRIDSDEFVVAVSPARRADNEDTADKLLAEHQNDEGGFSPSVGDENAQEETFVSTESFQVNCES